MSLANVCDALPSLPNIGFKNGCQPVRLYATLCEIFTASTLPVSATLTRYVIHPRTIGNLDRKDDAVLSEVFPAIGFAFFHLFELIGQLLS